MTEGALPQEVARPMVWVYVVPPFSERILAPLLWGLEEEGIPGKVREFPEARVETLAGLAAEDSPLAVGIGVNEMTGVAVLHHRDLLAHGPLFTLKEQAFESSGLRRLGVNAARLVKRMPLVFNQGPEKGTGGQKTDVLSTEDFEKLVSRVVAQILKR
jgi:hypothetical protein